MRRAAAGKAAEIGNKPDSDMSSSIFTPFVNFQVIMLVTMFLVCWTPYAVLSMAGILGYSEVKPWF